MLHSFLYLCRFVSHIETNVAKCKDKVKSEAFLLYSLMYVKEINKYIKKLAQTIVCGHKRLYLCNVFGRIHLS